MKKLILILLTLVALTISVGATNSIEIPDSGYSLVDTDDQNEIRTLMDDCKSRMTSAHDLAEAARKLGCDGDHAIIKWASKEWWMAYYCEKEYSKWLVEEDEPVEEIEETEAEATPDCTIYYTDEMYAQYPVACEAYRYLREEMTLSPAVAAGVIGSWMEECGGQTMSLNPYIYAGSDSYMYYGLAMWSLKYCPEVSGMSLAQQLNYFKETFKKNYECFGGSWDNLVLQSDPGTVVALYYKYYGRGYGSPSAQRIKNAYTAYEFFKGA